MAVDHSPYASSLSIPESHWRRLRLGFLIVALAALASAGAGLWRASGDLGRPFGGFAWVRGYRDLFWVYPTTPYHWPAIEGDVRLLDVIVTADGRSPAEMARVFSERQGGSVAYEVMRGGQSLAVTAPVVTFTLAMYWELYGPLALSGLSALIAAQVLLRRTRERSSALMASFLLICGGMALNQVNSPHIHSAYSTHLVANLIWTFGYPLAGAVTWHFALVFPRPRAVVLRRPGLQNGVYLFAAALGTVYSLSDPPVSLTRPLEPVIFPLVLAFALSGLMASVGSGVFAYRSAGRERAALASYAVRRLAIAWVTGVILYSYMGFALDLAVDPMPLVTDMIFSMAIIYPLLLVYAMWNVQTVEQLRRHLSAEQAMRQELGELRHAREKVLNEVADDLHAYVLPDIRGLQMSAAAAAHYGKDLDSQYASQILESLYRMVRRIMDGVKPVALEDGQLRPSVQRMLDALAVALPELGTKLEAGGAWDENFSLALKEELFRILQSAVTNVRDHAQSQHMTVALSRDAECLYAAVSDDGCGFDVEQALRPGAGDRRRHLGMRNMRARAESLGGQLVIESGPTGTRVAVTVPLVMPRPEVNLN